MLTPQLLKRYLVIPQELLVMWPIEFKGVITDAKGRLKRQILKHGQNASQGVS